MAREARLPGAVMPGTEWLVDEARLTEAQFSSRGRPSKKKAFEEKKARRKS
jgi:hypothetical protein